MKIVRLALILLACLVGAPLTLPAAVLGFYNFTLYPGDNLLSYQMEHLDATQTNNTLNAIFHLGATNDGSTLSISPLGSLPPSFYSGSADQWSLNYELPPGQGARLHLAGNSPLTLSISGVVPYYDGTSITYAAQDPGPGYFLLSYPVPVPSATFQDIVGRDPHEGEWVVTCNGATQAYLTNRFKSGAWTRGVSPVLNLGEAAYFNLGPFNLPPLMAPVAAQTAPNTPLVLLESKLLMNASDPNGDPVTISAASAISTNGGQVFLGYGAIIYTPVTGFVGQDQFTITLSDGQGGFLTNTVSVTVSDLTPAPVAAQMAGGNLTVTGFGTPGWLYTLEYKTNLSDSLWLWRTNLIAGTNLPSPGRAVFVESAAGLGSRFYRLAYPPLPGAYPAPAALPPAGMALIFGGDFLQGDALNEGFSDELPLHTVSVSAFYMDTNLVSQTLWDDVYNWATNHGYSFNDRGSSKGANHPVQTINWWDAVKWCNARSEKEGLVPAYYTSAAQTTVYRSGQFNLQNSWIKWNAGYRLPTEAEWEKAARAALPGKRFPWGDLISQGQANYYSFWLTTGPYFSYDLSPTAGYPSAYNDGVYPYTSPAGSFAPNAHGLFDMAGNLSEWCWDWYGPYGSAAQTDPYGPVSGDSRVVRGGSWYSIASDARCAGRNALYPFNEPNSVGFRCVRRP